jgi:crotonobetainyl-CoA:carnitine CoA-transferase CaiB-like acyl-CoA transferase
MGMEPERLRTLNPRLIIAQLQSFDDPTDERPAFDMVLQAEAGFLYMNGEPDRAPVKMPVALIDLLAGHQLKEAILIALLNRERSGEGAIVRVSLLESALASLANQASNYLNTGFIPQRMGTAHPNIAPYGDIFQGSDGVSLVLAVGTERQFQRLCEVLGKEEWLTSPTFCSNAARVQHREALNTALERCLIEQKAAYWINRLEQVGVPVALIRNMESVFQLPAAQAMILEEEMEDGTISKRLRTNAFKIGF